MTDFKTEIGRLLFEVEDEEVAVSAEFFTEILTIEDVFKLAEFAAAAHTALTGAPYVHTEYDKGEFVVKEGVAAIPKRGAPVTFATAIEGLERDCE
ncbi:hypothetical protein SEA_LYELL_32 [Microbacterium phage Lyell]|nr:hypothetical protein SEA_LYELL_32 [Microbacterium phage Lyell]